MQPEDRLARAIAEVEAHHHRRAKGEAESADELLSRCGDLRELIEPMLEMSSRLVLSATGPAGAAMPTRPAEPTPDRFGHFRLLSSLGSGGMGRVHLAFDETLERQVALKQIRPENLDSHVARARFEREARAVSRLDHPNLCQVFYTGEDAGIPYLVMQYVAGETLKDKIVRARSEDTQLLAPNDGATSSISGSRQQGNGSGTPTTQDEVGRVLVAIEKVARALHHAHEAGLVHRDIKPGNIMIKDDGEPIVLDFGLVREEHTDFTLTDSLQQLGTPLYMAPEQIAPAGRSVDRRADVYAIGATLYECLSLSVPFTAGSRQELFDRILDEEPPRVDQVNRAVPTDLAVVVAKALEKEPKDRYRSALELADDLARVRRFEPIRARPAGVVLRLQRWVRRNRLAAATIVAITIGFGVSVFLLSERNTAMAMATTHLDNFHRLGIRTTIRRLDSDPSVLPPPWPEYAAALEKWLEQAKPLRERRQQLALALDEVRGRALEYSEADRHKNAAQHPSLPLMRFRKSVRGTLAGHLALHPDGPISEAGRALEARVAEFDGHIAALEKELEDRWVYRFADDSDQFLHDSLVEVAGYLDRFLQPEEGLLEMFTERLRWAETIAERSIDKPAAAWREAIEAIATSDDVRASKSYGGMQLQPQMGLVPIGMDPESKLWEFHHLRSGEAPVRDPETGRLRVTRATGIVFVLIPAGVLSMGAQADDAGAPNYDPQLRESESPVHEVKLDAFFIAKHELTQGQWFRLDKGGIPSLYWAGSVPFTDVIAWNHPVDSVSWKASGEAMQWHGLCLPTEAQWEYACRAGRSTRYWSGQDRDSLIGAVNLADRTSAAEFTAAERWPELDDGFFVHAPVDSLRPNPFGLHLMNSNVSEWCADIAAFYTDPVEPGTGLRMRTEAGVRIVRGASFADAADRARSAFREGYAETGKTKEIGVRACRRVFASGPGTGRLPK